MRELKALWLASRTRRIDQKRSVILGINFTRCKPCGIGKDADVCPVLEAASRVPPVPQDNDMVFWNTNGSACLPDSLDIGVVDDDGFCSAVTELVGKLRECVAWICS